MICRPSGAITNFQPYLVAEWSKAHAWKVCRRETVSRVRIPVCLPSAPAKAFSRSGCGRIFPLYSRVMRVGLSTGISARGPGSVLSGPIFSGPVDRADLVKFRKYMILFVYSISDLSFGHWSRLVSGDCHRNFSCHDPLEPLFPALPFRHHSVQQVKEGSAVVWLSDAAKLVGNDAIDGVNRGFDKASIEQETVRG